MIVFPGGVSCQWKTFLKEQKCNSGEKGLWSDTRKNFPADFRRSTRCAEGELRGT